jgi:hypothetical protein
VLTRRGQIAIEQLRAGDEVLAASDRDPEGLTEWKRVEQVFNNPPAHLLNVHVGEELLVQATDNHPWYVRNLSNQSSSSGIRPNAILFSMSWR